MTGGYSVVVPVYGNQTTLAEVHRRVCATLEARGVPFELIFVDDASPDGSWAMITALADADERVIGVRLERNVRQTRAIFAGIEISTVGPFVMLDADLDDAPEDLAALIDANLQGHDLVIARRRRSRRTRWRRIGSAIANRLVASGSAEVSDLGSSFMLAERQLEGPVRDELHRTGTQLVLPHVVAASRSPLWVDVGVPHADRSPSGYGLLALLSIGRDALGTWVAPRVIAHGRRAAMPLAVLALLPGPAPRIRRVVVAASAAMIGTAVLVRRFGTHPSDELYVIAEVVGPPAVARSGSSAAAEQAPPRRGRATG